jgi:hypothetical protein
VLLATALLAALRGLGTGFTSRVSLASGLALVAITVHSLFYSAFFEDPMAWALLGLTAVAVRVPHKPSSTRASGAPALDGTPLDGAEVAHPPVRREIPALEEAQPPEGVQPERASLGGAGRDP